MYYSTNFHRSDPFGFMRSVLRDFDRLNPGGAVQSRGFPAVNIWQGDEAVAVTAELPGIDPSDIDISVQENVLKISGTRKAPDLPEDVRWHRRERGYGSFSRAVRLPFNATDDKIEARMANGILRIVIGRPDEDKPKKIKIQAS